MERAHAFVPRVACTAAPRARLAVEVEDVVGNPEVLLRHAEDLFRAVLKAKPNDVSVLREYIAAVDSRARIDYSQMNESLMQSLDELKALELLQQAILL